MDLRRSLPTIGLVALLLLDLGLVVWALWPAGTTAASPSPSAGRPSTSVSSSASPSPSASASAEPPAAARPLSRVVSAASAQVVWAAGTGSCDEPGKVHVSRDGGKTWRSQDAPGAVTRIRPNDGRSGFVIGGDDQCRLRLWNTSDAGASWTDPRSAADAWGRDPDDATRVHRPGGDPVKPCQADARVLDLAGLRDGVASVVCNDGTVRTTSDAGARWTTSLEREGLVALALTAPGRGAVAIVAEDCTGVAVAALAGGKVGTVQCLEDVAPRPGQVSVSVVADATWLVAGDTVLRAPSADASTGTFAKVGSWPKG
ncbi:WD40/YVTN/BNR-like repeat-containing protein [Oryzobacter telluris]|uniref:WD40/YVTN/BNR-like repeat-containing protein n=1 Tax=Oryzobacter telluris TaxID=3149179 RepID=UPI00370DB922